MLTVDVTINGRTVHKYLVGRGPAKTDAVGESVFIYKVYTQENFVCIGSIEHDYLDGAQTLARKVLDMADDSGW